MIKNERQFRVSNKRVREIRAVLASLEAKPINPDLHPQLRSLELAALSSQLVDIESEIEDFKTLIESPPETIEVESLHELPQSLIRARIARGLTHRELANRLGLKEQAVQRYEATDYISANFGRLIEVADALGVQVRQEFRLSHDFSASTLVKRLRDAGVQTGLLERRFLTSGDAIANLGPCHTDQLMDDVERVFGWSEAELRSSGPLVLRTEPQLAASFKKPGNANDEIARAYVIYAHYIALHVAGLVEIPFRLPPTNWIELRDELVAAGGLTLRDAASYAWDLGIAVIPLQDPIAIHGAFWNLGDRAAIILKQGMRTSSRWLIDLLHELYHAATEAEGVVDGVTGLDEDTEALANSFAADIALNGRAEELVQMAVEEANGNMLYLKRSVQTVAERESVPVGILANVMAWRLTPEHDWWGTAVNLQKGEDDPWEVCRDVMLERVDLSRLPEPDRRLVVAALRDDRDKVDA